MDSFNAPLAPLKSTTEIVLRCLIALSLLAGFVQTPLAQAQTAPPAQAKTTDVKTPQVQTAQAQAPQVQTTQAQGSQAQTAPYEAPTAAPFAVQGASGYAMQAPSPYTIHVDDQLQVQVFGSAGLYSVPNQNGVSAPNTIPALTQTVTVLSDGTVNYPLIGSVSVEGLRPDAAAQRISDALTAFVIHPIVSVQVLKGAPERIEILGSVEHGGQYELQQGERLVDLLVQAGIGPQSYADLNHITLNRVVDGIPRLYNVNVYNMLLNADYEADPILQTGDVVYVPKAKQHNAADLLNAPFALYYLHLLAIPGAAGVIP